MGKDSQIQGESNVTKVKAVFYKLGLQGLTVCLQFSCVYHLAGTLKQLFGFWLPPRSCAEIL